MTKKQYNLEPKNLGEAKNTLEEMKLDLDNLFRFVNSLRNSQKQD